MNFEGRVAIITGGAGGMGKAIAKILLNNGMKISICDIDESPGKSFREELPDDFKKKVIFQKCDVSSVEEFRAVFVKTKSEFGRIDVVINNAGILNESQWKRMIEVNFIGIINGIQLAFEFMGRNNGGEGGYIINTASNAGLAGFDMAPVYSGTKHGVVGLTRSYSQKYHFDKTNVTVNAVCPGPTNTDMLKAYPKGALDEEVATKHLTSLEFISAEDVAKAVLKLLKDGKNGALLEVNVYGTNYVE